MAISNGCDCGATDCKTCFPYSRTLPECDACGCEFTPKDEYQTICDDCLEAGSVWCVKCGDEHPMLDDDDDDDFVCDDCKKKEG